MESREVQAGEASELQSCPPQMLEAVVRHSERRASLVGETLKVIAPELTKEGPVRLPAGFLLEFASVLELGFWESQGHRQHIAAGLPSFDEANAAFVSRMESMRPEAFEGPEHEHLAKRMLQYATQAFSWEAPQRLGAEIAINVADEDAMLDFVANYIWQNRSALSRALDVEE